MKFGRPLGKRDRLIKFACNTMAKVEIAANQDGDTLTASEANHRLRRIQVTGKSADNAYAMVLAQSAVNFANQYWDHKEGQI